MSVIDPFAVLEIAPTLDAAAVKRAYFAQLKAHPPHADPDGFRRLRTAYEALTAPGGLALACAAAPVDTAAELAAWRGRWQGPIDEAVRRIQTASDDRQSVQTFVESVSRLRFADAAALFAADEPMQ